MSRISDQISNEIVRLYLNNFSMREIAEIIGVSKTTVHTIINEWKQRVSSGNINDIRFFMGSLRESGITIEKCIEGFRIQQMLREFGIPDEPHDWIERSEQISNSSNNTLDNSESLRPTPKEESVLDEINLSPSPSRGNQNKKSRKIKNSGLHLNPVSYFVQILYKECKNHKISPAIAVNWMIDMLDNFSASSFTSNIQISNESEFVNDDVDNYFRSSGYGQGNDMPYRLNTDFANSQLDQSINSFDLPLVSKVSFFIDQKKSEIKRLKEIENKITYKIQKTNEQRIKLELEVNDLLKKREKTFGYYRWYENLRKELSVKYNLNIESEIESFSRSINDFKYYEYDPFQIIKEYKNIESLNQVRQSIRAEINLNTPIRDHLLRQVSNLQNQVYGCDQTIRIYNEISLYGFGLNELKKLWHILVKISTANNISSQEVGKKFLKDIEDQYDDKVGFENNIRALKMEKEEIEAEVPNYKSTLTLRTLAAPSLLFLQKNGVLDSDIIFISELVLGFKKSDFLLNFVQDNNKNKDNKSNLNIGYENNNNRENVNNQNQNHNSNRDKIECWSVFIQKLKEWKNINHAINSHYLRQNTLQDEINALTIRKQNLDNRYLESSYLLNNLIYEIANVGRTLNHLYERVHKDMTTTSRFFPVFMLINDTDNSNDEEKLEGTI